VVKQANFEQFPKVEEMVDVADVCLFGQEALEAEQLTVVLRQVANVDIVEVQEQKQVAEFERDLQQ
jgi:hypothetical protein